MSSGGRLTKKGKPIKKLINEKTDLAAISFMLMAALILLAVLIELAKKLFAWATHLIAFLLP